MIIDMKKIEFELESKDVNPKFQKAKRVTEYDIKCYYQKKEIGLLQFTEYIDALGSSIDPNLPNEKITLLYLDYIEVKEEFRKLGLSQILYEEFGKIYSEQFDNWKVARCFDNPIAEYVFKKAIFLGLIPKSTFYENFTSRNAKSYYKNLNLIENLTNKLPCDYTLG